MAGLNRNSIAKSDCHCLEDGIKIRRMEYDMDKVDEAVLALLFLTLHDGCRAWKGHDWEALGRLHEKGMIYDPVGKAKSVVLTEQGLQECERLFAEYFSKGAA